MTRGRVTSATVDAAVAATTPPGSAMGPGLDPGESHDHPHHAPRGHRLALGPQRLTRRHTMHVHTTTRAGYGVRIDGNGTP
ncbi:MAG TPA: hypothetical protein VEX86_10055 [Longimicrobium sp.]|nr:hypothetical protein [Longimicrobium sp.]